MLMPKRVKYRRQHRGRMKGQAKGGTTVSFGEYGLQAIEPSWITSRQIESARIAMTRFMKRGWRVCITTSTVKPDSAIPMDVLMRSGKRTVEGWIAGVNLVKIMFNVGGVSEEVAPEALRIASHKPPIRTKFVKREEIVGEG